MNIVGFIPARMASSRFPGKPLAEICGTSMLEHVYRRSLLSERLADIYVATCDKEIAEAVEAFGGKVIITKDTHQRASDRVAEALLKAEEMTDRRIDIALMAQGDEPLVFPEMIDEALKPLIDDENIIVSNLMAPVKTRKEQEDRNEIKVVADLNNFALYFSREPIPTRVRLGDKVKVMKQVCIIPFRRDFLLKYIDMPQTPLEIAESIDMMRVLENGLKVKMVPTKYETYSVDTPEDLKRVEAVMENDPLFKSYGK